MCHLTTHVNLHSILQLMQKIMTSKKHVCFLQHMKMYEKNGDHSTSVNVDFFQSCFQIELDQNNNEACTCSHFFFCIDHYKKSKKFKPQLECCICDKSIYSHRCLWTGHSIPLFTPYPPPPPFFILFKFFNFVHF